ncbi:hypothetical protein MRY87_00255 [bacterium]|nr:hypothetical protein [bacterium]
MKNRIESLLYQDAQRLPLLALVPECGQVEDLPKYRTALLARLEGTARAEHSREGGDLASGTNEGEEGRDEREMLRLALQWIALQEES